MEGEAPPDKAEWLAAVRQALADEVGIYRVRFHREPSGWRFDLECRSEAGAEQPTVTPASESVTLNVYALLAARGKPLDPDWIPRRLPRARRSCRPLRSSRRRPLTHRWMRKSRLRLGPGHGPPSASRAERLAILGLALAAGWMAWDRIRRPPTSPPATLSAEALSAQVRLRQLEAEVAQLQKERVDGASPAPIAASPRPRAGATAGPTGPRATPAATVAPRARATPTPLAPVPPAPPPTLETAPPPTIETAPPATLETAPPPTTAPAAPPTTTPAPPPAATPTEAEAAAPAPVERGALVDIADPGVTRPVVVAQGQPRYPPLALQRGIEGRVVLSVLVNETGEVAEV